MGLRGGEAFEQVRATARGRPCILLARDGRLVATWNAGGYESLEVAQSFEFHHQGTKTQRKDFVSW